MCRNGTRQGRSAHCRIQIDKDRPPSGRFASLHFSFFGLLLKILLFVARGSDDGTPHCIVAEELCQTRLARGFWAEEEDSWTLPFRAVEVR